MKSQKRHGQGVRLYEAPVNRDLTVADLLEEAKKTGVVQGRQVLKEYLTNAKLVPRSWHGKVVLFAGSEEDEEGVHIVAPCLILWTPESRPGYVPQKQEIGSDYAVAIG